MAPAERSVAYFYDRNAVYRRRYLQHGRLYRLAAEIPPQHKTCYRDPAALVAVSKQLRILRRCAALPVIDRIRYAAVDGMQALFL